MGILGILATLAAAVIVAHYASQANDRNLEASLEEASHNWREDARIELKKYYVEYADAALGYAAHYDLNHNHCDPNPSAPGCAKLRSQLREDKVAYEKAQRAMRVNGSELARKFEEEIHRAIGQHKWREFVLDLLPRFDEEVVRAETRPQPEASPSHR